MARLIYCALLYLAWPLIGLRLLWRSRRQPAYREHLAERFGRYAGAPPVAPLIWVHAVSVGETRAAEPLIEALRGRYPDHRILLTAMTPTGRATAQALYGERVISVYLPYDYPGAVHRFLQHFQPALGVLMETEIWPNLLHACRRHGVPVFLANARLSERSARGYARFAALAHPAFAALSGVAAQSAEDAARLRTLGAAPVEVCGNLKFDVSLAAEQLALGQQWRLGLQRPVWLAASTRDGEEEAILKAWLPHADEALLVLVPRHPQRFAEVAALLERHGLNHARRSAALPDDATQVWLGDSMGEMAAYYAFADLAFIGGSLLPLGGQNLIEAAVAGCPVLVGQHTFNFKQATEQAISAGAAYRVADAAELVAEVRRLLADPAALAQMKTAGLAFAATHRGATGKTLDWISARSDPAGR